MSISFTPSIINRLKREIADMQKKSKEDKQKLEKAQSKIKQLQRDMKKSTSPNDLSNKMTRINKLNQEIDELTRSQRDLAKQLVLKKAALDEHLAKEQAQTSHKLEE